MEVLKVVHVDKNYRMKENIIEAVKDVTMEFETGKIYVITGHSGSGKSTFLRILGLLTGYDSGNVIIDKIDTSNLNDSTKADIRNQKIGFVFQNYLLNNHLKAYENVMIPMYINKNIPANTRKERAKNLLKMVGLSERVNHFPNQLSGGEQQRVAIARALANDPKIILADEPTGALDSKSSKLLLESLDNLNENFKATVLMVTHDALAASYASRVIFIKDGKIFNELIKGSDTRKEFFDKIIDVVSLLGGEINDAL